MFYSHYSSIESGVLQGSVLGPLLFLVYINDLERNIKYNIKLFPDDTMLFFKAKNPEISANNLNHDLDAIRQWAHQWKNLILTQLSRPPKVSYSTPAYPLNN